MRYIITILSLLASFAGVFADTTFVAGNVFGVWTSEGNPFVIVENAIVPTEDTLIIEPGVIVLLHRNRGMGVRGTLRAIGREDDSITFAGFNGEYWYGIYHSNYETPIEFQYCNFFDAGRFVDGRLPDSRTPGAIENSTNFIVKHCYFKDCVWGIRRLGDSQFGLIEDCLFRNIYTAIEVGNSPENVIIVRNCVFDRVGVIVSDRRMRTVYVYGYPDGTFLIENCLFIEGQAQAFGDVIVKQCIFYNRTAAWIQDPWGRNEDINYVDRNCFISDDMIGFGQAGPNPAPEDLGVLDRVNANGDSTDRYGNLFLDPRLIMQGNYPEYYFLREDSPCIDAGDPEGAPNPDQTVADIGPFFFPQCNITVEPRAFDFNYPAGLDTAAVWIYNVGLRDLRLFATDIIADGNTPFIIEDPIWEMNLPPGDSLPVVVRFEPREDGEYRAELHILSNDRDEDTVRVELSGVSLSASDFHFSPFTFHLFPAWPNPFNNATTIRFSLESAQSAKSADHLTVHDLSGRLVAELWTGRDAHPTTEGGATVVWDAKDYPAGVYLLRLKSSGQTAIQKLVLMR